MKAAPEEQLLLLDVQRLDNEATRLEHRVRSVQKGDALAELGARAASLRAELASATGTAEDSERELARLESDTTTANARVDRDTKLLAASASTKDVAGLESELANLRRRISDLETASLEVMERVDAEHGRVRQLEAQLVTLSAERDTLIAARDAELAALESERASTAQNRATLAARVPSELMALYERQRARYGFGASLLQGGVSSASGVELAPSDLETVQRAALDDVLLCPDSEAILVRTAESGL